VPRATGHWISRRAWEDILRLTETPATQIAVQAGLATGTLKAIAARKDRASADTARRIAGAAGVDVTTLFPTLDPFLHQQFVKAAA